MVISGISSGDAIRLKHKFGDNVLPSKETSSWYTILFAQFKNPLVILLLLVGSLSFSFGETLDLVLIALVIFFNILSGFIQEYSAHKTLLALRKIIVTKAFVIRDGKRIEILTKDLVPDDVVIISSGDKLPADGKLIQGTSILVNEAVLTGEEEAVVKDTQKQTQVYMGTTVISGQGMMLVESIGTNTKMGKIGQSLSEIKEESTPLQRRLEQLSKTLIVIVVLICLGIFVTGVIKGWDFWETVRISIVLSIAAVPEGLPIAVTVILSIGMHRILKRKGLVKRLLSIETLGSTSVICLDKTGTITEGKMQVVKTDYKDKDQFLLALTLLNDRKAAIEAAIWDFLKKETGKDPDPTFDSFERTADEPFDSARKYKGVVNQIDHKHRAFVMGAPDIVVEFCRLDASAKKELLSQFEDWATKGLRLIGVITKDNGELKEKTGFKWLGLVGIEDPVRKEASQALMQARSAGIQTKIVTGDYRITAEQVARKIGMEIDGDSVMDFEELDRISDEELADRIERINLFSRVTPLQKLKIIAALQKKGEIVAMTGDGVNDAPALKKADIGIVVESGTDVAKETADLILLDSNFQTIINACEEGRLIISNTKKVIAYVLSNSFAEMTLIFGSMLLQLPIPLSVAQILWIHLICDGPPDIMLGFEPKEKDIMQQDPKKLAREPIFSNEIKFIITIVSLTIGLVTLFIFDHYVVTHGSIPLARTIIFAILGSVSMVYIFSFKNLKKSIFQTENLFANRYLLVSVIYGLILVLLAIYVPILNRILGTVPLALEHWLFIIAITLGVTFVIEMIKFFSSSISQNGLLKLGKTSN